MDFRKFKRIMSYCKQYGGATLDGFGKVVKFDSGLQYKGLDFFKLIDVIRNDYELEDTLIKEVIEFTKY